MRIEPEWYCPILPMVLVNGCEGIGTGFSTNVPNYDVREIVTNLKALLAGRSPADMVGVVRVKSCVGCTCGLMFCGWSLMSWWGLDVLWVGVKL